MRACPALLLLILAACEHTGAPSYAEARRLLRSERYQESSQLTETALHRLSPDTPDYRHFRVLRVELLLARREAREALAALAFQLPPNAPPAELGRYRLCQGYAAALLHDYSAAHTRLDEAEALAASAGDAGLSAEVELRKGYVAVGENHPEEARRRFESVLAKVQDPYLRMNASGNLGYLLLKSFHYDAAIPRFEETLSAAQSLSAAESQARCLGNLGWCFYRLGDFDKALHYFQQADASFQNTRNRYEHQLLLGNIGSIYLSRASYSVAADYYRRALETSRALEDRAHSATWLTNLALISIETGAFDAASRYNEEASAMERDLGDEQAQTYCAINAARIALGQQQFAHAAALFRQVLASPGDDPSLSLDAHAGLAAVFAGTRRSADAAAEYRAAIATMETQRSGLLKNEYKLTWFASLIRFYQSYVDYLLAHGNSRAALEVADSSRARLLSDKLGISQPRQRVTAADYQAIARDSGSTILSYWSAPGNSRLWVITPEGISTYSLPSESAIRALVEAHQRVVENLEDPLTAPDPAGAQLYTLLLAPAEAAIRKTRRVLLLPDGPLCALNFETLPVAAPQPHYWIEDAVVSITPSLHLLAPGPAAHARDGSLLLIGNPTSPDSEFPVLPFAGQEMAAIRKSLPAAEQVVRAESDARPDAYLRAGPDRFSLIHFVAHADVNRDDPLQSAVILSRHAGNFKLLARDIAVIPIHADLVTVSACRSAAARTYAGEGLVGFSWAFLQAGARNVIASLWDVNDRSTAALMSELYAELARGTAPADALHSARLAMIHSGTVWRKPWYWGPSQIYTTRPEIISHGPALLAKK